MVKFIHAADLHLDSPFKSRSKMPSNIVNALMNSTFVAAKRMFDYAIENKVDFVILSGDVFDANNRSLKSEIFLKEQFERLENHGIFTYMIHGNHDPVVDGVKTSWPSTVKVFRENVETYQTMTQSGENVFIHGFSYYQDESYESKLDHYPTNNRNDGIHIGLLHGTYSKSVRESGRYTEFTLEDLNSKLYHYWALGHIHMRQTLSEMPLINYSGNIQGRHVNESGEKGFLLVEGDSIKLRSKFVPVQDVLFESYELDVTSVDRMDLYQVVTKFKNKLRADGRQIIKLSAFYDGDEDISSTELFEVINLLQEDETDIDNFIWVDEMKLEYKDVERNALINDIKGSFGNNDTIYKESLNTLYMDPKVNRYLPDIEHIDREKLFELGEEKLKLLMRK